MAKSAGPTKKAVNQSGVRKSVRNLMSTNAAFKDGREGKGIGGKKMAEGVPRHVSSDSENVIACPSNAAIVDAPSGTIINSCISMGLSAWAPPLIIFIIGIGRICAPIPPI